MSLMMASPEGISAFPASDSDLTKWKGRLDGPDVSDHGVPNLHLTAQQTDMDDWFAQGTYYAGQTYAISLEFPSTYPFAPPKVRFESTCYHPNVDLHGNICLDILKEKWSPMLSVSTVLISLQSLMGEPNNASPLNVEAAELWDNKPRVSCQPVKLGSRASGLMDIFVSSSPPSWPSTTRLSRMTSRTTMTSKPLTRTPLTTWQPSPCVPIYQPSAPPRIRLFLASASIPCIHTLFFNALSAVSSFLRSAPTPLSESNRTRRFCPRRALRSVHSIRSFCSPACSVCSLRSLCPLHSIVSFRPAPPAIDTAHPPVPRCLREHGPILTTTRPAQPSRRASASGPASRRSHATHSSWRSVCWLSVFLLDLACSTSTGLLRSSGRLAASTCAEAESRRLNRRPSSLMRGFEKINRFEDREQFDESTVEAGTGGTTGESSVGGKQKKTRWRSERVAKSNDHGADRTRDLLRFHTREVCKGDAVASAPHSRFLSMSSTWRFALV